MTGASLLAVSGLGHAFNGGGRVLSDVSFTLGRGEVVSLLGPSGCGKSTVLRLVAGLMDARSGSIAWDGDRPELGFVFQDATLMPWATALDNVALPLRLKGVARAQADRAAADALERVGLADRGDAYPRELSGGMRMRVSIARALVVRPRVLLMDEPFAALDEITRFRLNDDLLALTASEGWSVLFVTHSVYEAVYLSDRVLVMGRMPGRIVSEHAIDLAKPRGAALRAEPDYAGHCRGISTALAATMEAGP